MAQATHTFTASDAAREILTLINTRPRSPTCAEMVDIIAQVGSGASPEDEDDIAIAQTDFGAIVRGDGEPWKCEVSLTDWQNALPWVRTAFAVCGKDRAELTKATREMYDDDESLVLNLIGNFDHVHGLLTVIAMFVRAAYARTIIVGELVEDERIAQHHLQAEVARGMV